MRRAFPVLFTLFLLSCSRPSVQKPAERQVTMTNPPKADKNQAEQEADKKASSSGKVTPTNLVVHNVVFHTGSTVKLKVKLLRGLMYPTNPDVAPSFDETKSFRLEIDQGILGVSVADLSDLLHKGALGASSLSNARISPQNGKLKITGTLKKVLPLPIQLLASVGVAPDHHQMRVHIEKISVLKVPVKGLLNMFSVKVNDLFDPKNVKGVTVTGNDIDIDVNRLLPPPEAVGTLTQVKLWKTGDLMEYYGNARDEAIRIKEWRNFMRLRGGTVSFGKLTMHNADLLMVDTSQNDWLNFDVEHYQDQLVNGNTHITPSAGLQIFIPDINKLPASSKKHEISLTWMKNRNVDPPPDVK